MIKVLFGIVFSMVATALKTVAVIYLLGLAVLFIFQRQLLFPAPHDLRTPEQVESPQFVELEATSDGRRLTNWYAPPGLPGRPVLVYFHGNASSQAQIAPWMKIYTEAGYGVLIVAYRGYNGDAGRPSEEGLYADSRAALEMLKQAGFGPERVVLLAQSLGTGVAVQMASEGRGSALILESPYTSMVDTAAFHYPLVPVRWLLWDRFDNLSKIGSIHLPLLIISGALDNVVPQEQSRRLFDAANEPKQALWIPDAAHNDLAEHGSQQRVLEFLKELAEEPRHEPHSP